MTSRHDSDIDESDDEVSQQVHFVVSPPADLISACDAATYQGERQLLSHVRLDDRDSNDHELKTAPIMTRDAYAAAGGRTSLPQRGLLGSVVEI